MKAARYLFLLLVPAIPYVQGAIDRRGRDEDRGGLMYLRSGAQVRRLSPGLEDLLADMYWLRTVQYNGRQRLQPGKEPFSHLGPLLEITTTLDPRLEIAYWYGAIFLGEQFPGGKGAPEEGVALLETGVRNVPGSWRLRQNLAFYRFLYLKDAKGAAATLLEAARIPGAPFWLETLAAQMLASTRERDMARSIWKRMFEQADEGALRDNARYNLERLDALDAADAWTDLARQAAETAGRPPRSFAELRSLARGRIPDQDPTGVPFAYDPASGTASISRESRLWRSQNR